VVYVAGRHSAAGGHPRAGVLNMITQPLVFDITTFSPAD
jgi:hypothetical protein